MVLPLSVESRFSRVEQEFAARSRLTLHGLRYKRKILMYGPPGCGKSMGAERLAWNTGLQLVKVRFDAMISSYFGESATNLRKIFESVKSTPCLLFLDECDFIARSRSANNDVGEVSRIVNTLLQLLEEYDAPGLLVAATNLSDSLDRALFRRFDYVFEVPLPGKEEIQRLLTQSLSGLELATEIQLDKVASKLDGVAASVVVQIANEAAKTCVLSGHKVLALRDLESAITNIGVPSLAK